MLTSIISMTFVIVIIMTKPIARVIERINGRIKAAKKDKVARRAAMERYMQMHALDIEH